MKQMFQSVKSDALQETHIFFCQRAFGVVTEKGRSRKPTVSSCSPTLGRTVHSARSLATDDSDGFDTERLRAIRRRPRYNPRMSNPSSLSHRRWLILASSVVSFFAVGVTFFAVPPLVPQLVEIFGLTRLQIGILMGAISLALGYAFWRIDPHGPWRTMLFTTMVLAQMGNALAIRSSRDSLFRIGILSNRLMVLAVLASVALQLMLIYVPVFQRIFKTKPLSAQELLICLLVSLVVFVAVEVSKWFLRRRDRQQLQAEKV